MNEAIKMDEKWRPKTFADLAGNQPIVTAVKKMVKSKNIPHLLFAGTAGTGKTSLAMVIVNTLYKGSTKRKFIEINASDDNGIETIRNRVKKYAELSKGDAKVPFRIIILDEADELTPKAQAALRRIMEKNQAHCRFILICNWRWKLIDPIQSRCSSFEFSRINPKEMYPRLNYICEAENIEIEQEALEYICNEVNGDMRAAFNNFIEKLKGSKAVVTLTKVKKLDAKSKAVDNVINHALNGKFVNARQTFYRGLNKGFTVRHIINRINEVSILNGFPDMMKGDISLACLESEKLLIDGCSQGLVIAGLIARLSKIGKIEEYKKARAK